VILLIRTSFCHPERSEWIFFMLVPFKPCAKQSRFLHKAYCVIALLRMTVCKPQNDSIILIVCPSLCHPERSEWIFKQERTI
ncbi:MAG: hypothetical protein IJ039_05185, partial [Clostridia bacterium]|nr:hypothetical protein [Clostridia bacterium]